MKRRNFIKGLAALALVPVATVAKVLASDEVRKREQLRDLSGHENHGTLTNMDPATDWVTDLVISPGAMGKIRTWNLKVSGGLPKDKGVVSISLPLHAKRNHNDDMIDYSDGVIYPYRMSRGFL
ncbi:unnamed protein product [marine sediment metagenome]|uniref:Uncharacterized protein n=1 Tax=marine sediment metagenome TaxID=412755 RepID=X1T1N9_9ZZZZ